MIKLSREKRKKCGRTLYRWSRRESEQEKKRPIASDNKKQF